MVGQIFTSRPGWISFVEEQVGAQPDNLIASVAGAALFLPVDDRTFAICFGHIHRRWRKRHSNASSA